MPKGPLKLKTKPKFTTVVSLCTLYDKCGRYARQTHDTKKELNEVHQELMEKEEELE